MSLAGLVTPNIQFVAGTTWVADFLFQTLINGVYTPVDLTGVQEILFTVKPSWDTPDAAKTFQKTKTAGAWVVSSPTSGVARLTIAAADTLALPPYVNFVWDAHAKLQDSSIVVPDVFRGILLLYPSSWQTAM